MCPRDLPCDLVGRLYPTGYNERVATTEITRDNLHQMVGESSMVLLDFWASWCGPCRSFAPVFESASEAHPDMVFGKVNTEEQQELAAGFGVTSIPTLVAFREGVIVFTQPGALSSPQLEQVAAGIRGLDMDGIRASMASQEDDVSRTRP